MSVLAVFEFFPQNTLFRGNDQDSGSFYDKNDEKLDLDKFNLMMHGNAIALVVINNAIYSIPRLKSANVLNDRAAQHSRINV